MVFKRKYRKYLKRNYKRKRKERRPTNMITTELSLINTLQVNANRMVSAAVFVNSLINAYKPQQDVSNFYTLYNSQYFKNCYDEYRVNRVNLHYIPTFNVNDYTNLTVNGVANVLPSVIIAFDADNRSLSDVRSILTRKGVKYRSLMKEWKVSFKIPVMNSIARLGGASGSLVGGGTLGWINTNETSSLDNLIGGIFIASTTSTLPNWPAGTGLGVLKVSYSVTFKGRQDNNIAAADDTLHNHELHDGINPDICQQSWVLGHTGAQGPTGCNFLNIIQ